MPLLSDDDRQFLEEHLAKSLEKPVKLICFTQTIACQFCKETVDVLQEVEQLSDKISLEVYNFVTDQETAEQYGVDKIPATVVMSDVDYGIRFYGIPSGYEFTSLIEDIMDVSRGATDLSEETLTALEKLTEDIHMQVFVTPTCPYCPTAVRMAHSMAIASDRIRADMVESVEFPQLANKYGVYGVPKTILSKEIELEGAAPEPLVLAHVLWAAGIIGQDEVEQLMSQLGGEEIEAEEFEPGEAEPS